MLEKHGNLVLTDDEKRLILSGVIPKRIAEYWGEVSLQELQSVVDNQRTTKGDPDGCK